MGDAILDFLTPELLKALGDLPIVTLCMLVIYGQFVVSYLTMREVRRDVKELTGIVSQLLVRIDRLAERREGK